MAPYKPYIHRDTAVHISVGIVTYNSVEVIGRTVESISSAVSNASRIEILVRDNGSRDGTVGLLEDLSRRIDSLQLISGGDNIGYGRGHNCILRRALGDIHIICNPDIVVRENFFQKIEAFLDVHPDVGLMSPRMTFEDGTLQHSLRRHPNVLDLALRRFLPAAYEKWFRTRLSHYEMADNGYATSCDVPFCSGALMVCRREALDAVGGFDERYFLYFEDADLCREMQRVGWRTVFNHEISVIHDWQRASHKDLGMMLLMVRNGIRYFQKWGWRWW